MSTAAEWTDLSSNNPYPDVRAYRNAGHTHISRKVSEGLDYHWTRGDNLARDAHDVGLTVGHYHWLRPDSPATAQADYFIRLVTPNLRPGDRLTADLERTGDAGDPSDPARAQQLRDFATRVANQLPAYPIDVYTGNWYLDGKPALQAECRRWPIIMSDYSPVTTLPNPYGLHYVAWQFSQTATVAGLSAPVDYNRWIGTPSTPADTIRAALGGTMYALYRDSQTGHWYIGAPGHWIAVTVPATTEALILDPLCVNRADVYAAYHGHLSAAAQKATVARYNLPTATLARIKANLLTIGGK